MRVQITAGPWRYANGNVFGRHGAPIAFVSLGGPMHANPSPRTIDEADANGRAIAAAPNLLATLAAIAAIDTALLSPGDEILMVTSARAVLRSINESAESSDE